MPLPLGHALAGLALRQARPGLFFASGRADALFLMFLANLPDLDFLPGLLLGRPNLYHHGAFHSLGAALAVALGGALLLRSRQRRFAPAAALVFLAFASHLLLDLFALDLVPPYRLPLFWPFSDRHVTAPWPFFLNVTRSAASGDFFPSLLNGHNLAAALREAFLLGGAALAATRWRRRAERRRDGGGTSGG